MLELHRILAKLSADIHRTTGLKSSLELVVDRPLFELLCWELQAESLMMQDMQNTDDAPAAANKVTLRFYSGDITIKATSKLHCWTEEISKQGKRPPEYLVSAREYEMLTGRHPFKEKLNET